MKWEWVEGFANRSAEATAKHGEGRKHTWMKYKHKAGSAGRFTDWLVQPAERK